MPELPEVETVRTGLDSVLRGAEIKKVTLRRKDMRHPFPAGLEKKLKGAAIIRIGRRAKYLLFLLDNGYVLIAHLGMTGRFTLAQKKPKKFEKHDHVVFEMKDGRWLMFNDARRFGFLDIAPRKELEHHPYFVHLGPEPFDKGFGAAYLKGELQKRKGPLKPALMDQELVVGVGNIYASEALFLAKIRPDRPAREAAGDSVLLIKCIRKVLSDAIASGGSSLRDFIHVSGEAGYFQHHFNVYGRAGKPCFSCGKPIRSAKMAGRSTFWCERCQK